MFDDLLEANRHYRSEIHIPGLEGRAAKGLAIITCIDSRIVPLAMVGLRPGDAKIIRNAGARVTDDALRSLVLAVNLLGVTRVCLVPHTDCAMVGSTEPEIRARVEAASGGDASQWTFLSSTDQLTTVRADIERIRTCPLLPGDLDVGAFRLDVHTGALEAMDV
jgi:carbonic anhydrase